MPAANEKAPRYQREALGTHSQNPLDYSIAERKDKAYLDAAAKLAMKGYALWRTNPQDGPQAFFLERVGLVQRLGTLEAVQVVLAQIAGRS